MAAPTSTAKTTSVVDGILAAAKSGGGGGGSAIAGAGGAEKQARNSVLNHLNNNTDVSTASRLSNGTL